jgi:hypothetical protein
MERALTTIFLVLAALVVAVPCRADEIDDFIAQKKRQCEELARQRDALKAEIESKGSPPQAAERLQTLNAVVEQATQLIQQKPPQSDAEKREFARTLSAYVGGGTMQARSVESSLGRGLSGAVNRAAAQVADMARAAGGCTGQGSSCASHEFDGARPRTPGEPAYAPQGTQFFSTGGSGYKTTTEQQAREITKKYEGWQGGVVLEGVATGVGPISSILYDGKLNAFILNNSLVYFARVPPWTIPPLARAMNEKTERVAVSLGEIHSVLEKVLDKKDVSYDLKLTDHFLGSIVFGGGKWLEGFQFADGYKPRSFDGRFNGAVLFSFNGFDFKAQQNVLICTQANLDIRLVPLSDSPLENGGLLPDYSAIGSGDGVPREYIRNAKHLGDHVAYYRRERIIDRAFAYGEVAALLRALKVAGFNMEEVAHYIEVSY